ncbi:MAG: hypothetical protein ACYDC2_01685 [Solirubrobacteraceae bacterium]
MAIGPLGLLSVAAATLAAAVLLFVTAAKAETLADDGNAEWRVEQPLPPAPETPGVEGSEIPVSLGNIGDVEFWEPNRGALITSGNGGSVPPGVWLYDGTRWRELASQCGASDGRVAWTGPDEFWTVSDERPGQAIASSSERPPLEDNTLCRFAPGPGGNLEIVASYASLPFRGDSYQAMHAAACLSPNDCWFGGDPLPAPQVGEFMLHWNGSSLEPKSYLGEAHRIVDLRTFEGVFFESMLNGALEGVQRPAALRELIHTASAEESPFQGAGIENHLLYSSEEFSTALDALHPSAAGETLWVAAGPRVPKPEKSREAGVTVLEKPAGGEWRSVLGPQEGENQAQPPPGRRAFPSETLHSIAAEPGTTSAWLALDTEANTNSPSRLARALLARIGSEGTVADRQELPSAEDPHGPLGAAQRVVCPATHDCWASTADGWLLHLSQAGEAPPSSADPRSDPVFARIEGGEPITFRPRDAGVPQETPDELPLDVSGETSFTRHEEILKAPLREPVKVAVALLTHVRTRLLNRTTLVLSFHLAAKAKVQLLALRHRRVVARTADRTLTAGNRSMRLKLDPKRWPQRLKLETHALAPLPLQSTSAPNVGAVSTSLVTPARLLSSGLSF